MARHHHPIHLVMALLMTAACGYAQVASMAQVGPASPTPPPIPTHHPLTPTPSLTPIPSATPTATPTWTPTITLTPTVTLTPTASLTPTRKPPATRTPTPTMSPTVDPNATVVPSSTAPPPTVQPPPPLPPSGFELGGQVPGSVGYGDQMRSAKMTWAKYQVVWTPGMDPAATSGYINDAHSKGFKALLSVKGPLYPSGIDYNSYVGFVRGVALLGADGIEIWNEMNLDREWPSGQIDPSTYVNNMLKPAYQAIKSTNPNTLVIAGALAPTGVHNGVSVWSDDLYLAGMRDAGAASYMDCLGAHHNAGATSPDATTGHPADGGGQHYSWYYGPTYNLYAGTFPNNKVCFTELGYLSPEGYKGLPPNFWWAFDTRVSEHAQWLGRAATLARASGRVRLVIVFNVGFTVWTDDPQAGYSIIRPGGSCPACSALAEAMP